MDAEDQRAPSAGTTSASGSGHDRRATPAVYVPERRLADRRIGRNVPASVLTPPAPPPPPHLDDYASIVGRAQIDALRFLAHELRGKSIKMVNSTALGGGVAEMLNRLVPLFRAAGPRALGCHHRRERFFRGDEGISQRTARERLRTHAGSERYFSDVHRAESPTHAL